ncbi:MAG: S8 family serine peptidase [Saprospiraceae bacterium]|nr:S8 family serine peptidase [Saprospiraceae bacterium]
MEKMNLRRFFFFVTYAFMSFVATAQTGQSKIHPSVFEQLRGQKEVEILVLMHEQADISAAERLTTKEEKGQFVFNTLKNHAERTQSGIQQFLNAQNTVFQSYWLVNSLYLKANLSLIQQIADRNDVAEIMNNPHTKIDLVPDLSPQPEGVVITWGIKKIRADSVWSLGYKGQNVVIGGEDTGYEWTHPALKPKYRGWNTTTSVADHNYNWHDAIHPDSITNSNPCGTNTTAPCDDHSHGTHTMGTMTGAFDTLLIGVAPNAKWIGARNMDRGDGTLARYVECFQFFVAPTNLAGLLPKPALAPHVINNSWSCPTTEGCNTSNFAMMDAAVKAVRMAGIVPVISAGNSGPNCSTINAPPATHAPGFAVGATASNDTIAGFSSRGPVTVDGSGRLKPDVSAPGVGVYSSVLNGGYANYSGTSMAGPHVAGVVALMISANPKLAGQVDTIENILKRTAKPMITAQNCGNVLGTTIPNNTYGYGRIDALSAVLEGLKYKPSKAEQIDNQFVVKVYPNPFSSDFTIYTEGVVGEAVVEIVNAQGQIIYRKKENFVDKMQTKVVLGSVPSGIYFYSVKNENINLTGKVVK